MHMCHHSLSPESLVEHDNMYEMTKQINLAAAGVYFPQETALSA